MENKMRRFLIQTSVEHAEGFQTWYVDAATESEALKKYKNGDGDIYESNVDVTSIGEPSVEGETDLDDFGDFNTESKKESSTPVKDESVRIYDYVWPQRDEHKDECVYACSYTPAQHLARGELLAVVHPSQLRDSYLQREGETHPIENTSVLSKPRGTLSEEQIKEIRLAFVTYIRNGQDEYSAFDCAIADYKEAHGG
jgi:hypothetical protein